MTLIQDGLGAVVAYLKAQSDISALLSERVFGMELPEDEAVSMPRKAIVIRHAGGIGVDSCMDMFRLRLDFFNYGETPFEAQKTWRTLRPILRDMERNVTSATMLFNATHSAGPIPFRDPDGKWPVVVDTWVLRIKETAVI